MMKLCVMDKSKFKKGVSVSKEFALFNRSSVGYICLTIFFEIRIININKSPRSLEVENISLILARKR